MIYCSHRVNTIQQLLNTKNEYGIEIDLRDDLNGNVYIAHDPFINGELFDEFLKHYNHSFIILKDVCSVYFNELTCFFTFVNDNTYK